MLNLEAKQDHGRVEGLLTVEFMAMANNYILEMIWQGSIAQSNDRDNDRFAELFRSLVPVNSAVLVASHGFDRPRVLLDEVELMPLLPIGDVVAEELSLDMPYGSLVVIRKSSTEGESSPTSNLSCELGFAVGEVLLSVLDSGLFPMEHESDALLLMARAYLDLVSSDDFRACGLDAEVFRSGIAASIRPHHCSVGGFDSGERAAMNDLAELMGAGVEVRSFQDWLKQIGLAVLPLITSVNADNQDGRADKNVEF